MKRLCAGVFGLVAGMLFLTGSVQAADKFATIDLGKVFSEYSKTKQYDKVLLDKQNSYETDRDKMVSDIKAFQSKIEVLSDKEKEGKKGEMETKIKSLQEFDRKKQTDLRKEQDERMKEILKDIEDTVKLYAESQGLTYVINDRVLVYKDKTLDITDKILETLNKGSAAKK